jgi:hypothetical protein
MQPDWAIANTTAVAQRSEIGIVFDWRVTGSVVTTNPALAFRRASSACVLAERNDARRQNGLVPRYFLRFKHFHAVS